MKKYFQFSILIMVMKVKLQQRPKGSEGKSYKDTWRAFQLEKQQVKDSEVAMFLLCSKNSKEASNKAMRAKNIVRDEII